MRACVAFLQSWFIIHNGGAWKEKALAIRQQDHPGDRLEMAMIEIHAKCVADVRGIFSDHTDGTCQRDPVRTMGHRLQVHSKRTVRSRTHSNRRRLGPVAPGRARPREPVKRTVMPPRGTRPHENGWVHGFSCRGSIFRGTQRCRNGGRAGLERLSKNARNEPRICQNGGQRRRMGLVAATKQSQRASSGPGNLRKRTVMPPRRTRPHENHGSLLVSLLEAELICSGPARGAHAPQFSA